MTEPDAFSISRDLISQLLDGSLDERQMHDLGVVLRNNPGIRDLYAKFIDLHVMLEWQLGENTIPLESCESDLAGLDFQLTPSYESAEKRLPEVLSNPPCLAESSFSTKILMGFLALAAMLAGVFVMGSLTNRNTENSQAIAAEAPAPIGHVTGSVEATWSGIAANDLIAGQSLVLIKGLVAISMNNGIELALEGPATLRLNSGTAGELVYGRLTVNVSNSTERFRLKTPSCEILDLGTEFGVAVQGNGTANVRVFEGSVSVKSRSKDNSELGNSKRMLSVGEAVRIDGKTGAIVDVEEPSSNHLSQVGLLAGDFISTRRVPVKEYSYETSPSESAKDWRSSYPDEDRARLTDGVEGTDVFLDGYWVGVRDPMYQPERETGDSGTPQPRIDLVLERPQKLVDLNIVYLVRHISGIYAPTRVRVTLSMLPDFSTNTKIIEFDQFDDIDGGFEQGQAHSLTIPLPLVTAKYVRLDFYNDHEWTFLSEIRFSASTEDNL